MRCVPILTSPGASTGNPINSPRPPRSAWSRFRNQQHPSAGRRWSYSFLPTTGRSRASAFTPAFCVERLRGVASGFEHTQNIAPTAGLRIGFDAQPGFPPSSPSCNRRSRLIPSLSPSPDGIGLTSIRRTQASAPERVVGRWRRAARDGGGYERLDRRLAKAAEGAAKATPITNANQRDRSFECLYGDARRRASDCRRQSMPIITSDALITA